MDVPLAENTQLDRVRHVRCVQVDRHGVELLVEGEEEPQALTSPALAMAASATIAARPSEAGCRGAGVSKCMARILTGGPAVNGRCRRIRNRRRPHSARSAPVAYLEQMT